MRNMNMEVTEIEEVVVRKRRGRPKKRHRADKACPRAEAKELLLVESGEKCPDALQIVDDDNVCCNHEFRSGTCDAQYKLFLDNLIEGKDPFMLEYYEEDRETRFLGFEVDGGPQECTVTINKNKKKKSRAVRNATMERTVGASKRQRSANGRVAEGLCTSRIVPGTQKGKVDVRQGRKNSVSKRNVELEPKSYVSCQRKSRLDKQPIIEELNFKACKNRAEKIQDMEDYKFYLTWMMDAERNSSMIPLNILRVKCEEKPESLCDSDIIAIDDHPFSDGDNNPFVAAKNYNVVDVDEENGGTGQICDSGFRKELMDTLTKPYSEKELHKLSRAASIQKPKTRVRQLRDGRDITYTVNILGKSYLHLYPDFRGLFMRRFGSTKFKCLLWLSLKDRHRALNMLRGFFFYLKNVVHDDAFRPWVDAECLETMPMPLMLEEAKLLPALSKDCSRTRT